MESLDDSLVGNTRPSRIAETDLNGTLNETFGVRGDRSRLDESSHFYQRQEGGKRNLFEELDEDEEEDLDEVKNEYVMDDKPLKKLTSEAKDNSFDHNDSGIEEGPTAFLERPDISMIPQKQQQNSISNMTPNFNNSVQQKDIIAEQSRQINDDEIGGEYNDDLEPDITDGNEFDRNTQTHDQIWNQLFNNKLDSGTSLLDTAEKEEVHRSTVIEHNKNNLVRVHYKYNEYVQKNERDIKNYEEFIDKLKKSKLSSPFDRDKKVFYEEKIESIKKIMQILCTDFNNKTQSILDMISLGKEEINERKLERLFRELNIIMERVHTRLPIYVKREEILKSIRENRVTAIIGKPGCGKSTQVPQMILEDLHLDSERLLYMITPRQVAAKQISDRIRKELLDTVGENGEGSLVKLLSSTDRKKTGKEFLLNFSTDTEFYRRLVMSKEINMKNVAYLVIDEANSKKMFTEVLVSISRKLLQTYSNLKLVFLCTSLDRSALNRFFDEELFKPSNCIEIHERNYMTEVVYKSFNGDSEKKVVDVLQVIEDKMYKTFKKRKGLHDANILMFLSGAAEVKSIYNKFEWLNGKEGLLSGRLLEAGLKTKYKIFMASGSNNTTFDNALFEENDFKTEIKLIFSTKVLETSLTIPGIGFVVDFGTEIIYSYDYNLGVDKMVKRNISKDTAQQREGRAGRTGRGVCYRLYKEEDYLALELSSESELCYKNIDNLVLSWVRVVLEKRKSCDGGQFFDSVEPLTEVDPNIQRSMLDIITDEIMSFDLITKLNRDSIYQSLRQLRRLNIIDDNILRDGESKLFRTVLEYGVEPKWGPVIWEAMRMHVDPSKSVQKGGEQKDKYPWVLAEVIDVIACNSYTRQVAVDRGNKDESKAIIKRINEKAAKYGDFVFNMEIFQMYKEKDKDYDKLGAHDGTIKRFDEIRNQLRIRAKQLLKLSDRFFDDHCLKKYPNVSEEERFDVIRKCLICGFITDLSKFINEEIGYYQKRIMKAVTFSKGSVFFREECKYGKKGEPFPPLMVLSDVVSYENILESRFSFVVNKEIVKVSYSKELSKFEEMTYDHIPNKIYLRQNLSTEVMACLSHRNFYFDQILGNDGYAVRMNDKDFKVKIATTTKEHDRLKIVLDKLIDYVVYMADQSFSEIALQYCRINVGNGGCIEEIMCGRDSVSFYYFIVPRYLNGNNVLKEAPPGVGPWDQLLNFKEYFSITNIDLRLETTFTKINYEANSPSMNLKVTCRTIKDKNKVRESVEKKMSTWEYPSDTADIERSSIKFYDKQYLTDSNSKPITLGLLFSLAQNKGAATISCQTAIDYDVVLSVLTSIKKKTGEPNIFGKDFSFAPISKGGSRSWSILLTNIDKHLDEIKIINFFKELEGQKLSLEVEVKMEKEDGDNPSAEKLKKEVDFLLKKLISNQEMKDSHSDEIYNLFIKQNGGYEQKKYRRIKECEIKLNSRKLAHLITETFDGKYYPRTAMITGASSGYPLGKQYTHIVKYDKPEFHVKKRIFLRMQPMLDQINKTIFRNLEKDNPGPHARSDIMRDRSLVQLPGEEILNNKKDEENIKLTVIKGRDQKIANKLENIVREYFNGYEQYIEEKYYSYFFGSEGKVFMNMLKNDPKNCAVLINPVETKSIWVIQEFPIQEEVYKVREAIKEKFEELDRRETSNFYIKVTMHEMWMMKKDKKFKEKMADVQKRFPSTKISLSENYNCLIIVETSRHELAPVEKELRDFMKEYHTKEAGDRRFSVRCLKCRETGCIVKLHSCLHTLCSNCIQDYCVTRMNSYTKGAIKKMSQPYFFCPIEDCKKLLSGSDLFRVNSETRLQLFYDRVIDDLYDLKQLPGIIRCACKYFNKQGPVKEEQSCASCETTLR